jgi:acid phosphatase family membrane protein YuiD
LSLFKSILTVSVLTRMGHTRLEIAAWLVTGIVLAWLVNKVLG